VSLIAKNLHLIESNDRESSVIQTGSILNSILGAHFPLFVTSAHSRQAGSSQHRQPGLPGIGGEPGGPVYRESVVKRLRTEVYFCHQNQRIKKIMNKACGDNGSLV
jgi:hypothetical protein